MDYNLIKTDLYFSILKNIEIKNNYYLFNFSNPSVYFFIFAKNYYFIMGKNLNEHITKLSILFEYLYINQCIFFNVFKKGSTSESLDLLSFLNLNILINKKLNELLTILDCQDLTTELFKKTNFLDFLENDKFSEKNIKSSLLDIFFEILKKQF